MPGRQGWGERQRRAGSRNSNPTLDESAGRRRRANAVPQQGADKGSVRTRWTVARKPRTQGLEEPRPTRLAPESPVPRGRHISLTRLAPDLPSSPRSPSIHDKGDPLLCAPGASSINVSCLLLSREPLLCLFCSGLSPSPVTRLLPTLLQRALSLAPRAGEADWPWSSRGRGPRLRTGGASLLQPNAPLSLLSPARAPAKPRALQKVESGLGCFLSAEVHPFAPT